MKEQEKGSGSSSSKSVTVIPRHSVYKNSTDRYSLRSQELNTSSSSGSSKLDGQNALCALCGVCLGRSHRITVNGNYIKRDYDTLPCVVMYQGLARAV